MMRHALGRRSAIGQGAAALVAAATRPAQAQPTLVTPKRGVCLSSWFANAPRQPLFERDFIQIADAGFDHVRVQVNPELIGYVSAATPSLPHPDPAQARWGEVDKAIALANFHGLIVVFDIHPEPELHARLESQPWVADDFVAFARHAAQRYKTISPNRFVFEIINEPQFYHAPEAYQRLAERLASAVRGELKRNTLLVGGPFGNGIPGLPALTPLRDPNVLYVFHYYQPVILTHQGIPMGFENSEIRAFRGLPYPASLVDPAHDYAPHARIRARAELELQEYMAEDWGLDHILDTLQPAADWAAAHRVRLICTEFGVYRPFIDPASRYRWIGDVRRALEQLEISWSVYDYADTFGITIPIGATATDQGDGAVRLTDPAHGAHRFEPGALAALGLQGA